MKFILFLFLVFVVVVVFLNFILLVYFFLTFFFPLNIHLKLNFSNPNIYWIIVYILLLSCGFSKVYLLLSTRLAKRLSYREVNCAVFHIFLLVCLFISTHAFVLLIFIFFFKFYQFFPLFFTKTSKFWLLIIYLLSRKGLDFCPSFTFFQVNRADPVKLLFGANFLFSIELFHCLLSGANKAVLNNFLLLIKEVGSEE